MVSSFVEFIWCPLPQRLIGWQLELEGIFGPQSHCSDQYPPIIALHIAHHAAVYMVGAKDLCRCLAHQYSMTVEHAFCQRIKHFALRLCGACLANWALSSRTQSPITQDSPLGIAVSNFDKPVTSFCHIKRCQKSPEWQRGSSGSPPWSEHMKPQVESLPVHIPLRRMFKSSQSWTTWPANWHEFQWNRNILQTSMSIINKFWPCALYPHQGQPLTRLYCIIKLCKHNLPTHSSEPLQKKTYWLIGCICFCWGLWEISDLLGPVVLVWRSVK